MLLGKDSLTCLFSPQFPSLLEAGLASAAVLISLGAVLGKANPLQVLVLSLLESAVFVSNSHLGYSVMGVADVGGAIFVHLFGAYFGVAAAFVMGRRARKRRSKVIKKKENFCQIRKFCLQCVSSLFHMDA